MWIKKRKKKEPQNVKPGAEALDAAENLTTFLRQAGSTHAFLHFAVYGLSVIFRQLSADQSGILPVSLQRIRGQ